MAMKAGAKALNAIRRLPKVLTSATVERRDTPLYSLRFIRRALIQPTKPSTVVFDSKFSTIGEYVNMIDPRTFDNLIDFLNLYDKGAYDMNDIKQLFPMFEDLNKEVEDLTKFGCSFVFDTIKNKLQSLSKDELEKLVDHAWKQGYVYMAVFVKLAWYGSKFSRVKGSGDGKGTCSSAAEGKGTLGDDKGSGSGEGKGADAGNGKWAEAGDGRGSGSGKWADAGGNEEWFEAGDGSGSGSGGGKRANAGNGKWPTLNVNVGVAVVLK